MPDREYEILCYIRKSHAPLWSDILNAHDPQNRVNEVHALLRSLLAVGLIEKTCPTDRPPRCRVRLTGRGVVALLEETSVRAENIRAEKEHQEELLRKIHAAKADRKAERRADRISQIFLSFLNYLLPLLLPPLLAAFRDLLTVIIEFLAH